MINILRTLLVLSLLIGTPTALLAQGNDAQQSAEPTVTQTDETKKDFQKKLEEEKQKFNGELDTNRASRVAAKCQAAQNKIGPVATRTREFQNKHEQIQNTWRNKLGELNGKLVAAGVDTAQLEIYLAEYDGLMEQARTGFETYTAGLDGVSEMKCADDPEGFYGSLQDARAARSLVVDSLQESKDYIQTTIKTELQSIKDQLTSSSAAENGDEVTQ